MITIDKILFPIDFSERCVMAASHVRSWALHLSASVVAMHVLDPAEFSASPDRYEEEFLTQLPTRRAKAREDLEYFCTRYLEGVIASSRVDPGDTAGNILALTREENNILVMMPRHHQSIGSRVMGDSIASKILDGSVAPVWFSEHIDSISVSPIRQILCVIHLDDGFQLEAQNERMLALLRFLAPIFSAQVTFLSVRKGERKKTETTKVDQAVMKSLSERAQSMLREIKEIGLLEEEHGDVAHVVRDAAERLSADLVVVGRTRPDTLALSSQGHILVLEHILGRQVLSVH